MKKDELLIDNLLSLDIGETHDCILRFSSEYNTFFKYDLGVVVVICTLQDASLGFSLAIHAMHSKLCIRKAEDRYLTYFNCVLGWISF
jgi:hypothetical protein